MDWREALFRAAAVQAGSPQTFAGELSASDPRIAELIAGGWFSIGENLPDVNESSAISIPSYSRAEEIVVGTLAGLPLKAYEKHDDGTRAEVASVLDEPQGPSWMTRHEWVTTLYTHLFRYREAYLGGIYSQDTALVGIALVHPQSVIEVKQDGWNKVYKVKMADGKMKTFYASHADRSLVLRQVLVPPFVGMIRGQPIYVYSKPTFQVALAALKSMGGVFTGPMLSGLVRPAKDVTIKDEEVPAIMAKLQAKMNGTDNASQLAFVNKHVELEKWRQTNEEAEYAAALTHADAMMATLTGIPPNLMASLLEKQTSWGTGVQEQNLGLSRYTLTQYSDPAESALKSFLQPGQYAETDFAGLLAGTPEQTITLLLAETGGKAILSVAEARAKANIPGAVPVELKDQQVAPQEGAATDGL